MAIDHAAVLLAQRADPVLAVLERRAFSGRNAMGWQVGIQNAD
jgi:hypothetical protein